MDTQTEMLRSSVLAKYYGSLVLLEVKPSSGKGKCPQCGETMFRESPHKWDTGWIECCNDDCDFQFLKAHLDEIESQWMEARPTREAKPE